MRNHTNKQQLQRLLFCLLFLISTRVALGEEDRDKSKKDSLIFHLPDVVVTAQESRAPGSTSLLPASAIEHVQPISAADLMQLLPGGLTGDSQFKNPQYFTVREISFQNGSNRTSASIAQGMQIVMDGSPLHYNTDRGNPYNGMDTRFLSMNEIVRAEVVRGIPSAQYGNLTNGLLKLKTRTGEMPLSIGIRYNPSLKQYTLGKGFRISPLGHTLNVLADYTSQDKFHTGGIRLANLYHWTPRGNPLDLSLAYTLRIGGENNYISEENHIRQTRQEHRFTLGSDWKAGRQWLETLSFRFDFSASPSTMKEHNRNNFIQQVATDATTSGEWIARVLKNYYYDRLTENQPIYAEAEAIATTQRPLHLPIGSGQESSVELKAGVNWRSEGNHGRGDQFAPLYPPSNSLRTSSYRETPFLHTIAAFGEALFRLPRFTGQVGLRYAGLTSRDYAFIGSFEPRINASWTAFSSGRYQLVFKAGAGWMSAMPTALLLYPQKIYNDRVSFYYNDTDADHSLALVTVHVPSEIQNRELRPTVNRKLEAGLQLVTPVVRLDMTAFFERQTGGFATQTDYLPFAVKQYEYLYEAGLRPEYRNGQVYVDGKPVSFQEVTDYTSRSLPVNALLTRKQGVEMTADFGTFHPLRTSLVVDGRWLKIRRSNTSLMAYRSTQETDGIPYPYIGYYDKTPNSIGNEQLNEQLSTNFRFITRIPRIGLVTTLTLQMVWMQKDQMLYNGGRAEEVWPLFWSGPDGIRYPFTEEQKENSDFAPLLLETSTERFNLNRYKPYGLLNLRVNKEFNRYVTLSFFANNLADMRPARLTASSGNYIQQNPSPFFGLEIQIKL